MTTWSVCVCVFTVQSKNVQKMYISKICTLLVTLSSYMARRISNVERSYLRAHIESTRARCTSNILDTWLGLNHARPPPYRVVSYRIVSDRIVCSVLCCVFTLCEYSRVLYSFSYFFSFRSMAALCSPLCAHCTPPCVLTTAMCIVHTLCAVCYVCAWCAPLRISHKKLLMRFQRYTSDTPAYTHTDDKFLICISCTDIICI